MNSPLGTAARMQWVPGLCLELSRTCSLSRGSSNPENEQMNEGAECKQNKEEIYSVGITILFFLPFIWFFTVVLGS